MPQSGVRISRLECHSLVAAHSGALLGIAGAYERSSLSGRALTMADALKASGITARSTLATPAMWATDRSERYTLPSQFGISLPLRCDLTTELSTQQSRSTTTIPSLLLFDQGALVLWGKTTVNIDNDGISVPDGIAELRHGRSAFEEHASDLLARLYPVLSEVSGFGEPRSRQHLEIDAITCRFELIDFDAEGILEDGSSVPYERIRDTPTLLRQLVGFLRLSREGVWSHYPDSYLEEFMRLDIGHREDDLWMVVGRRFFRRHPENRPDVHRYFSDVVLMTTAMVAREATLEALSEAISVDSTSIAKNALAASDSSKDDLDEGALARAASIMPTLMSPSRFADHFQHDFFREASEIIAIALGLKRLEEQVATQLGSYFAASGSLLAHSAEQRALRLDESVERLTRYILALTIAVLLVAVVQIILSFTSTGSVTPTPPAPSQTAIPITKK